MSNEPIFYIELDAPHLGHHIKVTGSSMIGWCRYCADNNIKYKFVHTQSRFESKFSVIKDSAWVISLDGYSKL